MVNHHHSPPFGIISLELFSSIEDANPSGEMDVVNFNFTTQSSTGFTCDGFQVVVHWFSFSSDFQVEQIKLQGCRGCEILRLLDPKAFFNIFQNYVVVSNIFYVHPNLGKWSNLTHIFFKWVGSTTNQKKWGPTSSHPIAGHQLPTEAMALTELPPKKVEEMLWQKRWSSVGFFCLKGDIDR